MRFLLSPNLTHQPKKAVLIELNFAIRPGVTIDSGASKTALKTVFKSLRTTPHAVPAVSQPNSSAKKGGLDRA